MIETVFLEPLLKLFIMEALALQASSRQDQILDLLQSWLTGVKEGVASKVSSCYSKNAALWGSVTQRLRCDEEGIRTYFEEFLSTEKHGLKVVFEEMKVSDIAGVPVVSGVYIFKWKDSDGQKIALPARYSFVLSNRNGSWKIEDHYSAVLTD